MTEITTFKGNWAEFPGEPSFYGARLSRKEMGKFDRACNLARKFRERARQTGLDFNKKYIVAKNTRHDPSVDYDKIAQKWSEGRWDEDPLYPVGGRVGDMVYFECDIYACSCVASSRRDKFLNAEKTIVQISLCDRWEFDGISLHFSMCTISKDGRHPCAGPDDWYLSSQSEHNSSFLDNMFDEFYRDFIDDEGYQLRPLSEEEELLYPNVDKDFGLSHVIPC
jgi:hypothetical protein